MDKHFFGTQVDRLRRVYSAAAMNDERVGLYWAKFKMVSNQEFEAAITSLILENTTQALPTASKISEAISLNRPKETAHFDPLPAFNCEACRDFGYGFVGDTVTACTCHMGRRVSPAELDRQQKNYDRGRKLFPDPQTLLKAFGARMNTSVAEPMGEGR